MITLYGIKSPYTIRVRAALIFKNLSFQHVSVNIDHKSETFKKLTLTETIPILHDDDGTIVGDSLHIIDYLDQKYPLTYPMLGRNLQERVTILSVIAAVDKIITFFHPLHTEREGRASLMREHGLSHRALVYDVQQKVDCAKEVVYRLGKLQAVYSNKKFLTGQFSSADAAVLILVKNIWWKIPGEDISFWNTWMNDLLLDAKIAAMFPAEDERGVGEI